MDFLNIKSATLTHNHKGYANKFVLNEDVCIIISPMYSFEEKPHDAVVELTDQRMDELMKPTDMSVHPISVVNALIDKPHYNYQQGKSSKRKKKCKN